MKIRDVWFKFFMDDWFIKTRHMTLELRGAYHEAICLIMKYEAPLPNDYRWIGHSMHVSERKAKAVIEELIAIGKLKRDENGISNDRCEKEIAERVAQRAAATAAALARHRPEVEPELGQHRPEIGNGKKAEQKQQKQPKSALPRARATDSDSEGDKKEHPPTPQRGAERVSRKLSKEQKAAARAAQAELMRELLPDGARKLLECQELFNKAAGHFRFSAVHVWTKPRNAVLMRRVEEIGGPENFRIALRALAKNDFLLGKVKPRDGSDPFRLDFDKLMQTRGNMGDVLAGLLDSASSQSEVAVVNGKAWGWWREGFDPATIDLDMWRGAVKTTAFQSATEWPWWIAGPPVGHSESFIPPQIVTEFKLDQKFGATGNA